MAAHFSVCVFFFLSSLFYRSALQKIANYCFPPANQTQQIYRYNFYLCQVSRVKPRFDSSLFVFLQIKSHNSLFHLWRMIFFKPNQKKLTVIILLWTFKPKKKFITQHTIRGRKINAFTLFKIIYACEKTLNEQNVYTVQRCRRFRAHLPKHLTHQINHAVSKTNQIIWFVLKRIQIDFKFNQNA